MGWSGAIVGGLLGNLFLGGLGPFGFLIGAFVGHKVEKNMSGGRGGGASANRRAAPGDEEVFCASAAAMLAKMAKADGVVTRDEIDAVEAAFARLGFSDSARRYAIGVFRRAKDDSHTIFEYAAEFAAVVRSVEVRELFYEMLWDLACADGTAGAAQLDLLRALPRALRINPQWFELQASERLRGFGGWRRAGRGQGARSAPPPRDSLAEAYALLGAKPSATDAELRRLYREKVKRNHPDVLRAQGLPEEMVGKANERMAKINAAWGEIKRARGMS